MKKNKFSLFITVIFFFVFFFLFSTFSLYRMYAQQIFHYDFGIFAKIIWQLSRFQLPFMDHRVLGNIFFLGDHFNPSLIILAPLFWITQNITILFFEQALATTLSGLMISLISKKLKFSYMPSLVFTVTFLLFAGTENPLVTDWHPESTAGFFLLLFFYLFNFTNHKRLSYLSAFIFLGFKESNALTFIFLLIWVFILSLSLKTKPKEQVARKEGLPTPHNEVSSDGKEIRDRIWNDKYKDIAILALFSIFWFFLTTKYFIPFFSHQPYMYSPDIPTSPVKMIQNYVNDPLKIKLIFDSFISFGFLPIFSFIGLIPIFLELGVRLIPNSSIFQNYALTFHYSVYLGIFLALATIYGVKNIKELLLLRAKPGTELYLAKRSNPSKVKSNITGLLRPPTLRRSPRNDIGRFILPFIFLYLLLISLYTARKITTSPINFAVSPIFWRELKPRQDFLDALKLIPKKGSVMSQNNILPYLATRSDKVYFLKEDYETYKPDIIVMDLTPGQNPNNFWDANYETAAKIKEKLITDKNYKKIKTTNVNLFIFLLNH